MMHLVYFSRKSQFLDELKTLAGDKMIITPSPAKADGVRSMLEEASQTDVVTISKFTSDLIKKLWGEKHELPLKRKAELMLVFGFLKNRYLPQLGYEQFTQAYNLFSDLRSFTLDQDALSSIMEEQSPDIQQAVSMLWTLMEATGFFDEHGAYQAITEELRSTEEKLELKKTFVFWGFQHLNGQQLDLLKALSIRYEVFIPFPAALKNHLKKSDWISWLKDSKIQEKDLSELKKLPRANWVKVNSREISKTLQAMIKPGDQVILGVSKLTPSHLEMVPSQDVSYKIAHQVLDSELMLLGDELKEIVEDLETLEQLEDYLDKKATALKKTYEFKKLKAVNLYLEAIQSIQDMTDEVIKLDHFFLKLLRSVVGLNQPRTSFVTAGPESKSIDLKDMSSLEDIDRKRRVIICIDDRFDEIQGLGQNYTETIQKALSTLGPTKRSELELLFKKWEFDDVLSSADVTVLMSESTRKHSLIWQRIFTGVDLSEVQNQTSKMEEKLIDPISLHHELGYSGSFSASKLQSFLDCPRKFYFSYVNKLFPDLKLKNDLDALAVGSIAHKIIEVFIKEKYSMDQLEGLTKKIMSDHLKQELVVLSQEKSLKHELVFNHRSFNGLNFLKKIEDTLGGGIEWQMEKEFSLEMPYLMKGKIDCLGIYQKTIFLLDFKSTSSSASTNKEVEGLESLQLWAYAQAASKILQDVPYSSIVMGYISLDNPEESNLLFSDQDLFDKFKLAKFSKTYVFKTEFPELFKAAEEKMKHVVSAIQTETSFAASPRELDVCRYCELAKTCLKGEATHV